MKKLLKIIIIIILLLNVFVLASCRSGWSCKKRYVNQETKTEKQNNIKNS